jgi:succinyl-CoA synthetase beta subunit
VEAAEEVGYPCVVKAQVRIGKRGKAGGIKIANDSNEARTHAEAILGMEIRGFTVHEVWVERASRIDAEYYASLILDRSRRSSCDALEHGRHGRRGDGRNGSVSAGQAPHRAR